LTVPLLPAGLVAVQVVGDMQLTFVAKALPKRTRIIIPRKLVKLAPVMVTVVPPTAGPLLGLMLVMVGAAM
jgi:hypothetical protein